LLDVARDWGLTVETYNGQNTGAKGRYKHGQADTIKEVAVEAGIPYSCVYNFFHEGADIQLSNVQKLADHFGYRLAKARPRRPKKRG
jgi:hypothetical protein